MHKLPIKFYIQRLKNYFWHLPKSIVASLIYGFPSRKLVLIGVTGTDGKTTTATLIHQILLKAGIKAEAITTINSPGLHTTSPDALVLQKIFSKLVKKGITHCVVETTAHGLDQFRFFCCHFKVGVLTNITHEHLDDFYNMRLYTQAKSRLFAHADTCIFNADDKSYTFFKKQFPHHLAFSINHKSDFQAQNILLDNQKLAFTINNQNLVTDCNYYYQIYNIAAAFAVTSALQLPVSLVAQTIKKFPETKGRREIVPNQLKIKTIIDFAHTPNALEKTLSTLKQTTSGKLICIFGATGGRDQSKRPLMGKVVSQIADIAIITSDDTRNEKIEDINKQIIAGIDPKRLESKKFTYHNIPNRQDAFNLAVKLASPHDTIIACGKGHETSILFGSTEYPWSESEAFRTAFRNLATHESI